MGLILRLYIHCHINLRLEEDFCMKPKRIMQKMCNLSWRHFRVNWQNRISNWRPSCRTSCHVVFLCVTYNLTLLDLITTIFLNIYVYMGDNITH